MALIWWGIALIIIGLLVSLLLSGQAGGALVYVGWILILVGIVLAIVHFFAGGASRGPPVA